MDAAAAEPADVKPVRLPDSSCQISSLSSESSRPAPPTSLASNRNSR